VEDYARTALHDMFDAVADDLDLVRTLDGTPVDAEMLACLAPALVGLLGLGIGLAGQARAGTGPGLAGLEEVLRVQGREVLRLLAQGGYRSGRA
jgi:hypothetical protein